MGLRLRSAALGDADDRVLIESPSDPIANSVPRSLNARRNAVPVDANGIERGIAGWLRR
jgi:DNA-binding transcriptional MocR family regulator